MVRNRIGWSVVGMSLCVCAHAGGTEPSASRIAPPSRIPRAVVEMPQPEGTPVATASMPRAVRRAVVADAARRFGVAEDAVVLSDAEQVTWSDGSLGCPQRGRSYTQMLVPGYRVAATTPSGRLLYHTDDRAQIVTCGPSPRVSRDRATDPRTQPPASTPDR